MKFPSFTGRVVLVDVSGDVHVVRRDLVKQVSINLEQITPNARATDCIHITHFGESQVMRWWFQSKVQADEVRDTILYAEGDVMYEWIESSPHTFHLRRTPDLP